MTQRGVVKKFKQQGLSLRGDALEYLKAQLQKQESVDVQHALLDRIVALIREHDQDVLVVSHELLQAQLHRLWEEQNFEPEQECIRFLSAFDHQRLQYNHNLNNYVSVETVRKLHGTAESKTQAVRGRLQLLRRRLLRHPNFDHSLSAMTNDTAWQLTPVESLIGSKGLKYVLGALSFIEEGVLFVEDLSGHVKLDLSRTKSRSAGFYTEGSIVLLQGKYLGDHFVADILGFPFPETRQATLDRFPNFSFTGVEPLPDSAQAQVDEYFQENEGASFVLLADVWLDRPDVVEHLSRLLAAYNAQPPDLLVLMGNFCSKPFSTTSEEVQAYRSRFEQLASLLGSFEGIAEETKVAIVPGPQDPIDSGVLPHSPIPQSFARPLLRLKNVTLCTNPCRVLYCRQEIVIFREDLLNKLSRNVVVPIEEKPDASEQLVKTIVEQGHLSPLPLSIRPVYWNYDHSLHLEVLPDVLVLADRCDQYEVTFSGCLALNPSSFGTDYSFAVYCPFTREVVFSVVEGEVPEMMDAESEGETGDEDEAAATEQSPPAEAGEDTIMEEAEEPSDVEMDDEELERRIDSLSGTVQESDGAEAGNLAMEEVEDIEDIEDFDELEVAGHQDDDGAGDGSEEDGEETEDDEIAAIAASFDDVEEFEDVDDGLSNQFADELAAVMDEDEEGEEE